jgi:hypothetical protein
MTYSSEQITYMLAEAINQNREYKSWHCSTQHLMALVERVVAEEREACANTAGLALLGADKALSDRVLKAIRARGDKHVDDDDIQEYVRPWVVLTDKEIEVIWKVALFADYGVGAELSNQPFVHYARAIEAKLKEKNT